MPADKAVTFPFKDNEELRDYIAQKDVGDTCSMKIKFQITDIQDDGVSGMVSEGVPAMPREMPKTEEPSPVMTVMARGNKRTSGSGY